jgi:hypothetical protein
MITNGDNRFLANETDYSHTSLPFKGVITKEEISPDGAWRLSFEYSFVSYQLIYFTGDFYEEWPEEIRDVGTLFIHGAAAWYSFVSTEHHSRKEILRMLTERTTDHCIVKALSFQHDHFPVHYSEINRYGRAESYASSSIDKNPDGTLNLSRILDPKYLDGTWGIDKYEDFVPAALLTCPKHNFRPSFAEMRARESLSCDICKKEFKMDDERSVITRVGHMFCSRQCSSKYNFLKEPTEECTSCGWTHK